MEKARCGLNYRVVSKSICSLEGQYPLGGVLLPHFKGALTRIHKNNGEDWLKAFH